MPAEDHHILKTYFPASASYSFTFNVFFWSLICSWETSLLEQFFISPHELMSIGCKHWAALVSLHEYMSSTGHWAPRELMGAVMSAHVLPGATRPLSTWHQLQLHLWKPHWTCCMRNCLSCGLRDNHIAQKWERFQISQVTGQRTILPSTSHLCLLHQRDAHWLSWSLQVAWSLTNNGQAW